MADLKIRPTGLTRNQQIVYDIADTINDPPGVVDKNYMEICVRASLVLDNRAPAAKASTVSITVPPPVTTSRYSNVTTPPAAQGENITIRNSALSARNNVFDVVDRVSNFIARAKNAGFAPPHNPFSLISAMNFQFTLILPGASADQIVGDISTYVALLRAEREGKLDLTKSTYNAAQLSHVAVGLNGFGNNNSTALALMSFLPDADALAQQKAQELLSALDFRKRIPKLLFTLDYAPSGEIMGSIVGWQKIADASGYVVKRHAMFANVDQQFTLSNADLKSQSDQLGDYVKTWVMTFYDQINFSSICIYFDKTPGPDEYYNYRVQAYQVQNTETNAIFNVETVPANVSLSQRSAIQKQMQSIEGTNQFGDTISPYPFLARALLGDSRHDWILAGTNVRASVNRADNRTTTRGYSYIGAQLSFLFQQMDQGKFLVPKDINEIPKRVTDAISQFGLSQVLGELLEETGVLFYFEGKDPPGPDDFLKTGPAQVLQSNLLSIVLSAVDPETATLDVKAFSTNIPQLLAGGAPASNTSISTNVNPRVQAQTTEISVPIFDGDGSDLSAQDDIQSLTRLDVPADGIVDLTTFDGISQFVRTIRVFSDYGPDRGSSVAESAAASRGTFPPPAGTTVVQPPPPGTRFPPNGEEKKPVSNEVDLPNTGGKKINPKLPEVP